MIRIHVECKGKSPLLMSPATEELLEDIKSRRRKPPVLDKSPKDEAAEKVIRDEEGRIGLPLFVGLTLIMLIVLLSPAVVDRRIRRNRQITG